MAPEQIKMLMIYLVCASNFLKKNSRSPLLGKDLYLPSAIPTVHFWLIFVFLVDFLYHWFLVVDCRTMSIHGMLLPLKEYQLYFRCFWRGHRLVKGESQIFNSLGGTIWNYADIFLPSYLGIHFENTQQSCFFLAFFGFICFDFGCAGSSLQHKALCCTTWAFFSSCRMTGLLWL